MSEKKWKIEFDEKAAWHSVINGQASTGYGVYTITFNDNKYGFISKEAWDKQTTGDILSVVERMLNDAHSLALKEVEHAIV